MSDEPKLDFVFDGFKPSKKENDNCEGLIFKAEVTQYRTRRGFAFTTKFNKMKVLSCKGCEKCGPLEDLIYEFIDNESPIIGVETVQTGKLYTFSLCNMYRDYESGYVEDFDIEVTEYKQPT